MKKNKILKNVHKFSKRSSMFKKGNEIVKKFINFGKKIIFF